MNKWFVLLVGLFLLPAVLGLELQKHADVNAVTGAIVALKFAVSNDKAQNVTFFIESDSGVRFGNESNSLNETLKLSSLPWSKDVASSSATFTSDGKHTVVWGFVLENGSTMQSSFVVTSVAGKTPVKANATVALNTTINLTANASTDLVVNTTPNTTGVIANVTVNETPPVVAPPPAVNPPPPAGLPSSLPASTGKLAPVLPIIGGALLVIAIGVIAFVVWLKKGKKID